jgi:peroxiredoxin
MLASASRFLRKASVATQATRTSRRGYADVPKNLNGIKATLRNKEGTVDAAKLFANKKVVVVGVPGAFTPVCSSKHIPAFVEKADAFKSKGVDDIIVVSVNDHHVMSAWEGSLNNNGKVKFLADPNGEFTRGINQEIDLTAGGLGKRSQRYSFLADNGNVVAQMVEKSPGDLVETTADAMLAALKK